MSDTRSPVAFVTGSTGYVGQAVIAELRSRNITTIAHIRPGSSNLARMRPTFESAGAKVDLSEWDPDALASTIETQQVTHVFCLIGTTRKQAGAEGVGGNIYEQIDYGLAKTLLDASVQSGCKPRFIYLSSIGADLNASSKYLKARGKAEATVRDSGLPFVLARPSFITGPDRAESRPAERIGAVIADGALSLAGLLGGRTLQSRYQSTTATELAKHLVEKAMSDAQGVFEGGTLSVTP